MPRYKFGKGHASTPWSSTAWLFMMTQWHGNTSCFTANLLWILIDIPYPTPALPYPTLPYLTTAHHTTLHNTTPHNTTPYHAKPCNTIPYHILYDIIPYHIIVALFLLTLSYLIIACYHFNFSHLFSYYRILSTRYRRYQLDLGPLECLRLTWSQSCVAYTSYVSSLHRWSQW